jgi:hypothetical protein
MKLLSPFNPALLPLSLLVHIPETGIFLALKNQVLQFYVSSFLVLSSFIFKEPSYLFFEDGCLLGCCVIALNLNLFLCYFPDDGGSKHL